MWRSGALRVHDLDLRSEDEPFMVEVGHDVTKAFVLLADQVLRRDLPSKPSFRRRFRLRAMAGS